ncbi:bifunctional hydroxymethylpyrimidine kinase/phosphomethylpyrimidine kinase [Paenibacillus chartarius]|uniref:Hydroxymethylpyrimidine/phosphomethylpyrimidine kinase n=1 Tax=Paenibacillus chartarius TaxID=747481 RepID=A0ABV6DPI7_9BACL
MGYGNVAKVLTIAGSDSGGGAGIQADLKTFQELGVYGMSAITAVTAQNTTGVHGVYPLPPEAVAQQLRAIGDDLEPQALKTGMLFSSDIIETVAAQVRAYGWRRLVVDPVMIAKGGASLLREEAVAALCRSLLPLAEVVTPNLPEAETLSGLTIRTYADRLEAAERILAYGVKYVVIKGGHGEELDTSVDVLYGADTVVEYAAPRVATKQTHGTGCTFAAAIAAELGKGASVRDAVSVAKSFVQAAIEHPLGIGSGHGPTNHWAYRESVR